MEDETLDSPTEPEDGGKDSVIRAQPSKEQVLVDPEVAELADRYFDLILFLKTLNDDLENSEYPLDQCLDAVVAVKRFLEIDPIVAQSGVIRPIAIVASTLRDVTLGGKPEILRASDKAENRPGGMSRLIARQGTAAACVQILVHHKMPVEDACKFVLRELEKQSQINTEGKRPVTWETVRRWREEMGSRNPAASLSVYQGISAELLKALGPDGNLEKAKKAVPNCIRALKGSGTTPLKI